MLWTMLLLKLLHTSLKWFILSHFSQFFTYAGHHFTLWTKLQYLHLLLVGIFTVVAGFFLFFSSFCSIASKFFTFCKLLMTATQALWANSFLPRLTHTHWVSLYSHHFKWVLLWFLLAFLSHSLHVWTILLITYLLVIVAFHSCCSKPTHPFFHMLIILSHKIAEL